MPPVKTQIKCPNCGQSVVVEMEQLFDVGTDPQAKQRFLSGAYNQINCPHCNFRGNFATQLVYHDPEKELLLTFSPPDLNISRDEQEKAIGRLITQVTNDLPAEKRKGYLFNSQQMLTMQGMLERVLEADGITKEMIESQQERLSLLQRMVDMADDVLEEVTKQEDEKIDAEFFSLLSNLVQASLASGDRDGAQKLTDLQGKLLPITTFGRQLEQQSKEVEAVIQTLQEAGEGLTREKLLDIVIGYGESELQLETLVRVARPGLDYEFFTLLTNRVEQSDGEEKEKLVQLREQLLEMTGKIDQQLEAHLAQTRKNLESLLTADDIPTATKQNLAALDDIFLQVLNQEYAAAREKKDYERLGKLQMIVDVLQEASAPSAEVRFLQELLEAPDEAARDKLLEARKDEVTPRFLEALTGVLVQLQDGKDKVLADKVRGIYRAAVRYSMESGMKKRN